MPTPYSLQQQHDWMGLALEQARQAEGAGEVPVGAVLIHNGLVLAAAHNKMIGGNDPTAHAEMRVLRLGAEKLGNYRLVETLLICTLEPCLMCYSAMIHARIEGLVYAASDFKTGIFSTASFDKVSSVFNHEIMVDHGLRAEEASAMLSAFFRSRRARNTEEAL